MAAKTLRGKSIALERLAASRMAIEAVSPCIDGGRFAAKAVAGWPMTIEAEFLATVMRCSRRGRNAEGGEVPMTHEVNDRWSAEVVFGETGPGRLHRSGLARRLGHLARDTGKKIEAGQDVSRRDAGGAAAARPDRRRRAARPRRCKALSKAAKAGDAETLLSAETAAFMARLRTARQPDPIGRRCRSGSTASARPSRRGTSSFRARRGRRGSTAPSGT